MTVFDALHRRGRVTDAILSTCFAVRGHKGHSII
jgi:hypothetical protein